MYVVPDSRYKSIIRKSTSGRAKIKGGVESRLYLWRFHRFCNGIVFYTSGFLYRDINQGFSRSDETRRKPA